LRDGWDPDRILAEQRAATTARQRADEQTAALEAQRTADAGERAKSAGWAAAISAALDDDQLRQAIDRVTTHMAGVERRTTPLCRAQLVAWAVAVRRDSPQVPLARALVAALPTAGPAPPLPDGPL